MVAAILEYVVEAIVEYVVAAVVTAVWWGPRVTCVVDWVDDVRAVRGLTRPLCSLLVAVLPVAA